MHRLRDPSGQASVELVALLPLIGVLAGLAWQAVVAGQAVWLAGGAARAAARASALGQDAERAARLALPGPLRAGLRVRVREDGDVLLRVAIPLVASHVRLATVSTAARFVAQR